MFSQAYTIREQFKNILVLHNCAPEKHVQQQLQQDADFRTGKIGGDEYTEKRQSLKQIKDSLREELSRMGVIT